MASFFAHCVTDSKFSRLVWYTPRLLCCCECHEPRSITWYMMIITHLCQVKLIAYQEITCAGLILTIAWCSTFIELQSKKSHYIQSFPFSLFFQAKKFCSPIFLIAFRITGKKSPEISIPTEREHKKRAARAPFSLNVFYLFPSCFVPEVIMWSYFNFLSAFDITTHVILFWRLTKIRQNVSSSLDLIRAKRVLRKSVFSIE